jgi:hypothetical protein
VHIDTFLESHDVTFFENIFSIKKRMTCLVYLQM